jgi:DNA-binding HxlR family transcriptional regulator
MELIHPSQELVILYSSTASTWLTTSFARSIKKISPDWLTSLLFIWLANRWESYKLAITTVI